jgi:hypothetical protein
MLPKSSSVNTEYYIIEEQIGLGEIRLGVSRPFEALKKATASSAGTSGRFLGSIVHAP